MQMYTRRLRTVHTRTATTETKPLRGKTGVTAPHYSGLLCSHPVRTLREIDVLHPFVDSKILTDEIQNHGTWFLKNSVNFILTDLD